MKKLVFGIVATVVFGNLSFAQSSFRDLFFKYKESSEQFYNDLGTFEDLLYLEENSTDCLKKQ